MQSSHWQSIRFCDSSISLKENEKTELIERMWYSEKKLIPGDHCGYFEFLQRERESQQRLVNTNVTFQHFITIRDVIYSNAKANRIDLWKKVREALPGSIRNDEIEGILIVVIILLLMIRVSFSESRVYVPQNQFPFLRNQSLHDILERFQTGRPLSDFSLTDRYPLWFNAIDLEKKAGLEIGWTDYMTEHLTIQSRKILLFRHIEVFKYLEQSETITAELLSQNFIAETMSSILLFFPTGNRLEDYNERFLPPGDRKDWLNRLINKDSQEVEVTRLFQDYPVWHQRLAYVLKILYIQNLYNSLNKALFN